MARKFQIKGAEALLAKLPEGEREQARRTIEEAFKDFDPGRPVGKPVFRLTGEEKTCPSCGEDLVLANHHTLKLPERLDLPDAGKIVQFVQCAKCEQPFVRRAPS